MLFSVTLFLLLLLLFFVIAVESLKSEAVVHGVIAGVPIPFHISNSDGCTSGINCPIHPKDQYKYTATLPVRVEYPAVSSPVPFIQLL